MCVNHGMTAYFAVIACMHDWQSIAHTELAEMNKRRAQAAPPEFRRTAWQGYGRAASWPAAPRPVPNPPYAVELPPHLCQPGPPSPAQCAKQLFSIGSGLLMHPSPLDGSNKHRQAPDDGACSGHKYFQLEVVELSGNFLCARCGTKHVSPVVPLIVANSAHREQAKALAQHI